MNEFFFTLYYFLLQYYFSPFFYFDCVYFFVSFHFVFFLPQKLAYFTVIMMGHHTIVNETPAETFPNFPSVLRVIDRLDRNPPITATNMTFRHSLRHASGL